MNLDYEVNAKIFKALSDPNRLKIMDMLSCGEKCACDILEHFDFTQPTLSHYIQQKIPLYIYTCRDFESTNKK